MEISISITNKYKLHPKTGVIRKVLMTFLKFKRSSLPMTQIQKVFITFSPQSYEYAYARPNWEARESVSYWLSIYFAKKFLFSKCGER